MMTIKQTMSKTMFEPENLDLGKAAIFVDVG